MKKNTLRFFHPCSTTEIIYVRCRGSWGEDKILKKIYYICGMKHTDGILDKFSSYLFWDVDKSSLNMEEHASYIIKRVLEYGQLSDWNRIKEYYTLPVIVSYVKQFRELEPRALTYISAISNIPIQQFRCYTMRQLSPKHWNF